MARPIWKGHISFGLVNIPVTLYNGEKKVDLSFRLVDSRNHARVRYERVNELTGEEVPWDDIVKAYEYDEGDYVLMTDEDFQQAAVEATQSVEIEDFVDQKAIDYPYFEKPYYLVPGKKGEKGYVLLRETLVKTKMVGIAKVVIHTRQHLAAVIPVGDALILALLRFHQELRQPSEFELPAGSLKDYKISPKELTMAEQLVESMTGKWDPEKYTDDYRDALLEWIKKKAESDGEVSLPKAEKDDDTPAGEIIDFMSLLKKSIEKTAGEKKKAKPAASARTKIKTKTKPKTRAAKTKTKAKSKAS